MQLDKITERLRGIGELKEEAKMPVLLVPILLGIPVLFVGGYYIIKVMH